MIVKYILHPGWVQSETDSDCHWISPDVLARLYGVNQQECKVWHDALWTEIHGAIHLYPRPDGIYVLPEVESWNTLHIWKGKGQ